MLVLLRRLMSMLFHPEPAQDAPPHNAVLGAIEAWSAGVGPDQRSDEAVAALATLSEMMPQTRGLLLEMLGAIVHDREPEPRGA